MLALLAESDSGSRSESASGSDESGSGSESEESGEETESEEEEEDELEEKKKKKKLDKTKAKKPVEESAERYAILRSTPANVSYLKFVTQNVSCFPHHATVNRAAAPRTGNEVGRQERIRKVLQSQRANQRAANQRSRRKRSQGRSLNLTPTSGRRRLEWDTSLLFSQHCAVYIIYCILIIN